MVRSGPMEAGGDLSRMGAALGLGQLGRVQKGTLLLVATVGLALIAIWAVFFRDGNPVLAFAGLAVLAVALVLALLAIVDRYRVETESLRALVLMADDPAACFITDAAGRLIQRNQAAEDRFGADVRALHDALGQHVLNPGELMLRLQSQAELWGAAREDIVGHSSILRLTVHRASDTKSFWRVDEFAMPEDLATMAERTERPVVAVGADLEDVPVAIMTFGPDGVMRVANHAARELMWRGEIRAAMFHDLFEGLGRPVSEWLADVVAGRHPGGSEVLRVRGEDERFLQITLRRYVEGGRPGALAILNDATRLK
ncbi:MAG: hypothetical protein EON48_13110, partial [Acetobacteraceae bacterium]